MKHIAVLAACALALTATLAATDPSAAQTTTVVANPSAPSAAPGSAGTTPAASPSRTANPPAAAGSGMDREGYALMAAAALAIAVLAWRRRTDSDD